jgi:hypothetical protein
MSDLGIEVPLKLGNERFSIIEFEKSYHCTNVSDHGLGVLDLLKVNKANGVGAAIVVPDDLCHLCVPAHYRNLLMQLLNR